MDFAKNDILEFLNFFQFYQKVIFQRVKMIAYFIILLNLYLAFYETLHSFIYNIKIIKISFIESKELEFCLKPKIFASEIFHAHANKPSCRSALFRSFKKSS